MKILNIKMSSMGDVIHALPVLSDIARYHSHAQVDWVVKQSFADLVRANVPLVRRVIPVRLRAWRKKWRDQQTRREWRAFNNALQSEAYDVVIDCQGLFKNAMVARLARLMPNGRRVGYDARSIREPNASWFYQEKLAVSRALPAVVRNRTLVSQVLGGSIEGVQPKIEFPMLAKHAVTRGDWQSHEAPYAVMSAALGRPTLGIYCEHDATLAPITVHTQGAEFVASLGGVGSPPSLVSVQSVLARWLP